MFFPISKILSFFLSPMLYFWVIFAVILWRIKKQRPITKWTVTLGTYLLILLSPLSQYFIGVMESQFKTVEKLEMVDAVVVLGGGSIYFDENSNLYILGGNFPRFLEASRLMLKSKARFVVASGGDPNSLPSKIHGESESYLMWLKELGIPEEKFILENKSLNTYQEAIFLKEPFQKLNIKSFYLVTTALHMPRSLAVFKKQGFDPIPYPVGYLNHPLTKFSFKIGNIENWNSLLHEIIGYIAYMAMGYI